jgi:large subunit ribosomal protein L33
MATSKRDNIILKCSVCGEQNYIATRNKRAHPDKMEKMKFCPKCKKMTLHKEAK